MKHQEGICSEIENALPLYVGGDLEGAATVAVEQHLEQCAACHARMQAAREAHGVLVRALRTHASPGPDLWSGVRAILVDEGLLGARGSGPVELVAPTRVARRGDSVEAAIGGATPLAHEPLAPSPRAAPPEGAASSWQVASRVGAPSPRHALRRWLPYSITAAAALAGFLVGRIWLTTPDSPSTTPTTTIPVAFDAGTRATTPLTAFDPAIEATQNGSGSVADSRDQLRRLQKGEPRIGDDADWYWIQDPSRRVPFVRSVNRNPDPSSGMTVGLQRVVPPQH